MRAKRVVIWLVFIFIFLAILAGVFWYAELRNAGTAVTSDLSYGLIASPLNGDMVFKGDPVYVDASFLLSHRNPANLQLYVDGAKYVLDAAAQPFARQTKLSCPSNASNFCGLIDTRMLWLTTDAGKHVLSACITGDAGQNPAWSVCTEDVNVFVTDLKAEPATGGTYLPQQGDTLETVANKFGLPPLLVAADNPGIKPAAELPGTAPVNIPSDPSLTEPPPGPGSPGSPWMLDKATMTIDLAVDKVYCYYSLGEKYWSRLPAGSQTFAYPSNGKLDLTAQFRSLTIPAGGGSLALECWGWSGTSLMPLGSGKTTLTPSPSGVAQLQGDKFNLDATLTVIPGVFQTLGKKQIIPGPQNLTSTSKLDVCVNHFPPGDILFGPFACKTAVEKGDIILVWDWLAPLFPPDDPTFTYATKIDGYHVYQISGAGKPSLIATVSLSDKKTLILSRTWVGLNVFMVRAYAGPLESADSNIYTLGDTASGLATVTIDSVVHYGGGTKKRESGGGFLGTGLCEVGLGGATIVGDPSIGGDEFAVGYSHWWPEDSCLKYYEEYSRAYSSFGLSSVKGPVDKATLSYQQGFTSAAGQSCARTLGVVTTDPSYDFYELLPSYGYSGAVFKVDVTSAVRDWMAGTPNNGFVLVGADESLPADCGVGVGCIGGGTESCWTAYSKALLTVTYFVK